MCRPKTAGGRRCPGHSPEQQRAAWRARQATRRARQRASSAGGGGGRLEAASFAGEPLPGAETATEGGYGQLPASERTAVMLADLQTAVEQIAASGRVRQWLEALASNGLRRWSANNRLLALLQLQEKAVREGRPELVEDVHLMGFRQWDTVHGRTVRRGEKAVWILAPMTRRVEEDDAGGQPAKRVVVTGFRAVPVFHIAQTDGPDLPTAPLTPPTGTPAAGVLSGLQERVGRAGYRYREIEIPGCQPATGGGTLGYTDPTAREVVVDQRLSPAQKVSTIAHELGHIHAGHVDAAPGEYQAHRGQMETEAEAAAYLTCRHLGFSRGDAEAFSPGYIAGWMAQRGASFAAAIDKAVKASSSILDGDWPDHD